MSRYAICEIGVLSVTENPRVGGSIPPLATIKIIKFNKLEAGRRGSQNLSYQLDYRDQPRS